jgi:major membrane immunogen (membrane-anchored lipoprotein)
MHTRTRTVADSTRRGSDNSVSESDRKYYKKGWYDLDDNGQMTVVKVTGVGKNGSIARVIYSGQDGQGRDHPAVWVAISDAQSVTGFNKAMSAFQDSLKDRKKKTVSVVDPVTESSAKPKSRQSIYNELLAAAIETAAASRAGKSLTSKEYSCLWEQAGVIDAQNSTVSRRTKLVSV